MGEGRGAMGPGRLEVGFGEAGDFHLMFEEAEFEWLIAVDGDDNALALTGFCEDVVTAIYAGEMPTALMEEPHEILTGHLFHAMQA